jgi:hypothetical protein
MRNSICRAHNHTNWPSKFTTAHSAACRAHLRRALAVILRAALCLAAVGAGLRVLPGQRCACTTQPVTPLSLKVLGCLQPAHCLRAGATHQGAARTLLPLRDAFISSSRVMSSPWRDMLSRITADVLLVASQH